MQCPRVLSGSPCFHFKLKFSLLVDDSENPFRKSGLTYLSCTRPRHVHTTPQGITVNSACPASMGHLYTGHQGTASLVPAPSPLTPTSKSQLLLAASVWCGQVPADVCSDAAKQDCVMRVACHEWWLIRKRDWEGECSSYWKSGVFNNIREGVWQHTHFSPLV